jgi:16S rRNA (uracil1498-N3)-methyltransferase
MASPYFYFAHLASMAEEFALNENSSRHIVQVLRMQSGESLRLTDGKGLLVEAVIEEANKKKCGVRIREKQITPNAGRQVRIGISLLKNVSRFEWFLEKATELGISEIIILKCARTEKQQFRLDRLQGILESALKQSQQVWMPVIGEPRPFKEVVLQAGTGQRFIAHCEPGLKKKLSEWPASGLISSQLLLIGPEGDFTPEEIKFALENDFTGVQLGDTRLRSETAALAGAAILKLL